MIMERNTGVELEQIQGVGFYLVGTYTFIMKVRIWWKL